MASQNQTAELSLLLCRDSVCCPVICCEIRIGRTLFSALDFYHLQKVCLVYWFTNLTKFSSLYFTDVVGVLKYSSLFCYSHRFKTASADVSKVLDTFVNGIYLVMTKYSHNNK